MCAVMVATDRNCLLAGYNVGKHVGLSLKYMSNTVLLNVS